MFTIGKFVKYTLISFSFTNTDSLDLSCCSSVPRCTDPNCRRALERLMHVLSAHRPLGDNADTRLARANLFCTANNLQIPTSYNQGIRELIRTGRRPRPLPVSPNTGATTQRVVRPRTEQPSCSTKNTSRSVNTRSATASKASNVTKPKNTNPKAHKKKIGNLASDVSSSSSNREDI